MTRESTNPLIASLLSEFHRKKLRYCHFKSNDILNLALEGIGDLDFLIDADDAGLLQAILAAQGFLVAFDKTAGGTPYVFHYYGLDTGSGKLIHLHVYLQLVTGGSILKNTRIPLEQGFLTMLRRQSNVSVPIKEIDLLLFLVRKFIEQVSPIEHFLFVRDYENIKREFDWLRKTSDIPLLRSIVEERLPTLSPDLLFDCITALEENASPLKRFMLGLRVRRAFPIRVRSGLVDGVMRLRIFSEQILRSKLNRVRKHRVLFPGGKFVAFVGSEASGKTSLSQAFGEWLAEHFDVDRIHLGKPPRCLLTRIPWLIVDCGVLLKSLLRQLNKKENVFANNSQRSLDYAPRPFVALLLAIDRERLVRRSNRRMMAGRYIVSDRFPSDLVDGPTISNPHNRLARLLSNWEKRLYESIPPPDLVFKTHAPLETTIERNKVRSVPEPDDWIRYRYEATRNMRIRNRDSTVLLTSRPLDEVLRQAKTRFWGHMSA